MFSHQVLLGHVRRVLARYIIFWSAAAALVVVVVGVIQPYPLLVLAAAAALVVTQPAYCKLQLDLRIYIIVGLAR
jgi:hypothetical protein